MFLRFRGQISRFRGVGLAGLGLALGTAVVALPGPAIAAGNHKGKAKPTCGSKPSTLCTISTRAVGKNDGFKLHLYLSQTNSGYGQPNQTTFSAILKRTRGHATQTNEYSFSKHIKVTGKPGLSSAHVTGTLAGDRGTVNMTFRATGPASKAAGRCGGAKGQKRPGVLSGSLTLKADKLGTVTLKTVKATLSSAINLCSPGLKKGYLVEGYHGVYYVAAWKASKTRRVHEAITVSDQNANKGYGFTYTYSVANEPTSDYTVGSKLSTATVKGAGGISGTAKYKGKKSSSYSSGKMTGGLSVKMAALGVVKPFASAKTMSGDQRFQK